MPPMPRSPDIQRGHRSSLLWIFTVVLALMALMGDILAARLADCHAEKKMVTAASPAERITAPQEMPNTRGISEASSISPLTDRTRIIEASIPLRTPMGIPTVPRNLAS